MNAASWYFTRIFSMMKACFCLLLIQSTCAFLDTPPTLVKHRRFIHRSSCCVVQQQQQHLQNSPYLSADTVRLDITAGDDQQEIGTLVFSLTVPSSLPKHSEHFISLARGDKVGLGVKAGSYQGCSFDYGPDYIQGESRYRWSHVCRGRSADRTVVEPENLAQAVHSVFGGQYYGDKYDGADPDNSVLLTVAVAGPGRGSDRFSIVRVGESPPEWGERLLLNSGVIGRLVAGHDVLRAMAQQRMGPPTIASCGVEKSQS